MNFIHFGLRGCDEHRHMKREETFTFLKMQMEQNIWNIPEGRRKHEPEPNLQISEKSKRRLFLLQTPRRKEIQYFFTKRMLIKDRHEG